MIMSNHTGQWTLNLVAISKWLPMVINRSKLLSQQSVNRMNFRNNTPHLDMSNLHNPFYLNRSAGILLRTI